LHIAFSKDKAWDFIDTLRTEKILEREIDGVFISAINQPVVFPSGGIHKDGVPTIERENGQFGFVAGFFPLLELESANENQNECKTDFSTDCFQPPAQNDDKQGVINSDGNPRWRGHIEIGAGNLCEFLADPLHR
jgi:hypothetical protein